MANKYKNCSKALEYKAKVKKRQKTCEFKRSFDSKELAQEWFNEYKTTIDTPNELYPYQCFFCKDWHLSKSKPAPPTRVIPNGTIDLTGMTKDRLTVVGLSQNKLGKWVVRCTCGTYEFRKAKSLHNMNIVNDCCNNCKSSIDK